MNSFFFGFLAPWRTFKFLLKHKNLFRYFLLPAVVNSLVLVGIGAVIVFGAGKLFDFLLGWGGWYGQLLYYFVLIVAVFGAVIMAIFVFTTLCNVIGAPFNEKLSEKIEIIITGKKAEGKFSFWRPIREEFKKFIVFDLGQLLLLLLNFIPVLGQLIYAVLATSLGWWLIAYGYLEIPMGRRNLEFSVKRKLVFGNSRAALGFGLICFLGTAVPVLNIFFIPLCVASGTKLYFELVE